MIIASIPTRYHGEVFLWSIINSDFDQVDGAGVAAKGDLDRRSFLQREIDITSEQVGGAGGYQPHRRPRMCQTVGDDAHRAVTLRHR
jgi:hypothetical protein